jgi:hypothetical protein
MRVGMPPAATVAFAPLVTSSRLFASQTISKVDLFSSSNFSSGHFTPPQLRPTVDRL